MLSRYAGRNARLLIHGDVHVRMPGYGIRLCKLTAWAPVASSPAERSPAHDGIESYRECEQKTREHHVTQAQHGISEVRWGWELVMSPSPRPTLGATTTDHLIDIHTQDLALCVLFKKKNREKVWVTPQSYESSHVPVAVVQVRYSEQRCHLWCGRGRARPRSWGRAASCYYQLERANKWINSIIKKA